MSQGITNERKIWDTALLLNQRFGAAAYAHALEEAERYDEIDYLTAIVWRWIARVVIELRRGEPREGEYVH